MMRILLDLDDVLCDFTGAACKAHGVDPINFEATRDQWDMVPAINRLKEMQLTQEEFWRPINLAGEEFWATLRLHDWAYDLIDLVKCLTRDWHIISSPSYDPSSYNGKVRWIKMHFGIKFTQFALTPHKEIFAQRDVILIDDREKTVQQFVDYGGDGIVFPSSGNSFRSLRVDPVGHVKSILGRYR